jgi:hypothetical protein
MNQSLRLEQKQAGGHLWMILLPEAQSKLREHSAAP